MLTNGVMLDWLTVAFVQLVIILIELQQLKCLCSEIQQCYRSELYRNYGCEWHCWLYAPCMVSLWVTLLAVCTVHGVIVSDTAGCMHRAWCHCEWHCCCKHRAWWHCEWHCRLYAPCMVSLWVTLSTVCTVHGVTVSDTTGCMHRAWCHCEWRCWL